MSHITSESDNSSKMILKDQAESQFADEISCEGSFSGRYGGLKKGPWTSAEDAILVDYVKKHGEGNWNAVRKHCGLSRCGKSCRLRWINHLRPNLKKVAFTPDEEQLIIKLHAKMGNKWAKMAALLPGRTDNEIKNYWNTRIKRRQRAGLPIYPPNVCLQSLNRNQSGYGSEFSPRELLNNELLQPSSDDAVDVNQGTLSCTQSFSLSDKLNQGLGSQTYGFIFPTLNYETSFPSFHGNTICGLSDLQQFSSPGRVHRPFDMGFPYDPDPGSENWALVAGVVSATHAIQNGNFSTSQTLPVAAKLELPSLQYPETDLSSWLMSPPTPPFEATGNHIESSSTVPVQSDCVLPRNSGLLEALLHEAQAMVSVECKPSEKSSDSSTVVPNDLVETSPVSLHNTDWGDHGDPASPLVCSPALVFTSRIPPISVSSLDESSGKASNDLNVELEYVEHVAHQNAEETQTSQVDFAHQGVLLGADWCQNVSKVHTVVSDTIAMLLDDLCSEMTCAIATACVSGPSSPLHRGSRA